VVIGISDCARLGNPSGVSGSWRCVAPCHAASRSAQEGRHNCRICEPKAYRLAGFLADYVFAEYWPHRHAAQKAAACFGPEEIRIYVVLVAKCVVLVLQSLVGGFI